MYPRTGLLLSAVVWFSYLGLQTAAARVSTKVRASVDVLKFARSGDLPNRGNLIN
jgi:hypothetical protein